MAPQGSKRAYRRSCDNCGSYYHLVNRVRVWTKQAPGHRLGWLVEEQRLCCWCLTAKAAERLRVQVGRLLPEREREETNDKKAA